MINFDVSVKESTALVCQINPYRVLGFLRADGLYSVKTGELTQTVSQYRGVELQWKMYEQVTFKSGRATFYGNHAVVYFNYDFRDFSWLEKKGCPSYVSGGEHLVARRGMAGTREDLRGLKPVLAHAPSVPKFYKADEPHRNLGHQFSGYFEKLAGVLGEQLGLNMLSYEVRRGLIEYCGGLYVVPVSVSENFVEPGFEFVPFADLFDGKAPTDGELEKYGIADYCNRLNILDYIIANRDRKGDNAGLLYEKATKKFTPSPVFDSGDSISDTTYLPFETAEANPFQMESFRSYTGAGSFDELREKLKPLPEGEGGRIDLKACIGVLPKPLRWPVESMLKNRVRELAELGILTGVSDEIVKSAQKLAEEAALLEQAMEDAEESRLSEQPSLDEKFTKKSEQSGARA